MRFRFVPVVVTVVAVAGLAWPASSPGQHEGKPSGPNVRQKVEGNLLDLERNLDRAASPKRRFEFLEKAEKELKGLRRENARQSEGDEIFMDQIEAILAEIPREKSFHGADCKDYETNLVSRFEPTYEGQAKNPAVKAGLKVLAELCR